MILLFSLGCSEPNRALHEFHGGGEVVIRLFEGEEEAESVWTVPGLLASEMPSDGASLFEFEPCPLEDEGGAWAQLSHGTSSDDTLSRMLAWACSDDVDLEVDLDTTRLSAADEATDEELDDAAEGRRIDGSVDIGDCGIPFEAAAWSNPPTTGSVTGSTDSWCGNEDAPARVEVDWSFDSDPVGEHRY